MVTHNKLVHKVIWNRSKSRRWENIRWLLITASSSYVVHVSLAGPLTSRHVSVDVNSKNKLKACFFSLLCFIAYCIFSLLFSTKHTLLLLTPASLFLKHSSHLCSEPSHSPQALPSSMSRALSLTLSASLLVSVLIAVIDFLAAALELAGRRLASRASLSSTLYSVPISSSST